MVKKSNGKWRIYVDFTDLNKTCLKDYFPLPIIDSLVDSLAGHWFLSFMDAFSGYNQKRMNPHDDAKMSFIIKDGIFCYKFMPFGLKNRGAKNQCLVNKIFKNQIGRSMEVHIDDTLIKCP